MRITLQIAIDVIGNTNYFNDIYVSGIEVILVPWSIQIFGNLRRKAANRMFRSWSRTSTIDAQIVWAASIQILENKNRTASPSL